MVDEKRKNMLTGSVLSDAFCLGAHWIYSQKKIVDAFGTYDRFHEPLEDSYHKNRHIGDHTHIGEQTLMLLDSIASNNNFNVDDFREYWVEKMSNYDGYIDHATKDTLENLGRGEKWGSSSKELAGGARMAPIIYCSKDRSKGVELVVEQTKVTHNSDISLSVARFFAEVAYDVLEGIKPSAAIERVSIELNDSYILEAVAKAKEIADEGIESLKGIKILGQTCDMDQALPSTIYLLVMYEESYREAIIANVMAGGDSASRGLLIGMLIGGYRGETIPREWLDQLKSLEKIHF